jgi:hypothetical protein
MKPLGILLVVLISVLALIAIAVGGWWFLSRKTGMPSPSVVLQATPIPINYSGTVQSGQELDWTISIPQDKAPGRLVGRWQSFGLSHGIKGATDDTLVGFEIEDGNDNPLAKTAHQPEGDFDLKYTSGNIIFVFDNSGILRSSNRDVVLTGHYQPD